ncbi:hypothetical protein [Desulforhopalus sp. 52FAK]
MEKITEQIELWMDDLSNNAIEPGSELKAFSQPLVGFASAKDELSHFIKNDIFRANCSNGKSASCHVYCFRQTE